MPKFMLILHDAMPVLAAMPPSQMEVIIKKYMDWGARLGQAGRIVAGEKLKDEGGKLLTAPSGKLVVRDGPYAEAKEVIGGFYIIEAKDYAEAVQLCSDCPQLELGGRIELREVDVIS